MKAFKDSAAVTILGYLLIHSVLATSLVTPVIGVPVIQQTVELRPGWNAVWLEVQPANNATDSVFSNLPVASVWTRAERLSSVEFIQNPSEETFKEAGWLGWFHPSRPEAFLGNLFAVFPNRAYLIKCTNSLPVTWNINGRPSLRQPEWVPDSYNLRGLPVDPAAPPTFLNFFRPSKAHYNSVSGQLQIIYRLNPSGQWVQAGPNDSTKSGEAYWIYSKGASSYLAPLSAQVDLDDGLDFGADLTELNLRLRNPGTSSASALVRDLAGTGNSILSRYVFDPAVGGQWPALPSPLAVNLAAGAEHRLRLAARRQDLIGAAYESVLEVRNGAGTRLLVPIRVEKPTPIAASGSIRLASAPEPLAGLWVGSATLNAVSEAHSADPETPTPTKSPLNVRLIIHVDATGQARLLKEVLQMWRNGTYTNDASGDQVVDKPGEYVLLTDDSLISLFNGSTVRDGESVGRRVSTTGYDFPSNTANNYLNLSGVFAIGESLSGILTLPHDHATNPFMHKFHPDHDNLNARFNGSAVESYTTMRQIRLDFLGAPPDGPAVPDFGYSEMAGTYRETIAGIHKNPIHISGTFRLSRVSLIAQLNPSPNP